MGEMECAALKQLVGNRLKGLHLHLRVVQAGIVVAAAALRNQNAEQDEEIARVLKYCVGERLFEQIERTSELIASLEPYPTDPSAVGAWDAERAGDG